MKNIVVVNEEQCAKVAEALLRFKIPHAKEEFSLIGFPEVDAANLLLSMVAICHQTQSLQGLVDGEYNRGWDYLSKRMVNAARIQSFPLTPHGWSVLSPQDVSAIFTCESYGQTLSDVVSRTALINDLGRIMKLEGWQNLSDLYAVCGGRAVSGSASFVELLQRFCAYQDPVEKKSLFLIGLLKGSVKWTFTDNSQIPAPVDYHEVRGHLRLGTVSILAPDLMQRLEDRALVTTVEDIEIRRATRDAISRIAYKVGTSSENIHYLFWNLFRTVCRRELPLCSAVPSLEILPERYQGLLTLLSTSFACPFSNICTACGVKRFPVEHQHTCNWY